MELIRGPATTCCGDMSPRGNGPDGVKIEGDGNTYLDNHFTRLDHIKKAAVQ